MAFKVQIINTINNLDNIILTSGLTIERLKIKYNWILNASVKNAIIGEDSYGIVWFSGEWICGEWLDGTWYSGIWHDGVWNNGKWYSYLVDTAMVISNRFVILDNDIKYSEFRNGFWKNGDFYNGTFGQDRTALTGLTSDDITNFVYSYSYWINGKFHDGLFRNSFWIDGIFYKGNMRDSYWINGKFYSGTYAYKNLDAQPNWYDGTWYGGDFMEGFWYNGIFDQTNPNIKSRFGTYSNSRWINGSFNNGEFHSKLNIDSSGNTLPSVDNNISHWMNGEFKGGKWYGGHFHYGNFINGNWYGGIFNTNTGSTYLMNTIWHNGNWYNGLWINGVFLKGHFYDGLWLDGQMNSGYISTNSVENPLEKQLIVKTVNLPIVTATTVSSITVSSGIGNGRVLNNGGASILDRGICWSSVDEYPVTGNTPTNSYLNDGGSMGNISIKMNGLLTSTLYYVRAWARNITGLTYSNTIQFKTLLQSNSGPQVLTIDTVTNITQSTAKLSGVITDSEYPVSICGFYYSDIYADPYPSGTGYTSTIPGGPNGEGNFIADLTGLTATTPYNFRSYAIDSASLVGLGNIEYFTTTNAIPVVLPTVTTDNVNNITHNTATGYGAVVDNGNGTITEMGVCWSTVSNPTISDPRSIEVGNTGAFTTNMTGLLPETHYYVRAYATNSAGTGYGVNFEIDTLKAPSIPTIVLIDARASL